MLDLTEQGPVPGQDRGAPVLCEGNGGAQGHGPRSLGGGGGRGALRRRPAGDGPAQVDDDGQRILPETSQRKITNRDR